MVWRGKTVRETAVSMGLNYSPVWTAVRGKTWSSITEPPPVPDGHLNSGRKPNENTVCASCGLDSVQPLTSGLCSACYIYQWRHGQPRPLDARHSSYIKIDKDQMRRLYGRYCAGEPLSSLASIADCSKETLRRRFVENGLARRGKAGIRQALTADMVRQARHLVHIDGWKISDVANLLDITYATVYDAVMWKTWEKAGGAKAIKGAKIPCARCGLLTDTPGLCSFCRKDGRQ